MGSNRAQAAAIRERTVELEREITDSKRAQESLRDSEQRFKDFAEAASDWFWEMDENLRFTYLSDRPLEIGGSQPEDLLGKTWQEADRGYEDNEDWRRHLACLKARRAFRDFQYPYVMPDGSIRHYSKRLRPASVSYRNACTSWNSPTSPMRPRARTWRTGSRNERPN